MIRRATTRDAEAIVALAVESVSNDPLPVKTDTEAMKALARSMIGNPAHFVWVGEQDGKVTACVAAQVSPGFWFRGLQASVILYYARTPGQGALLLRQFSRWCKSRSGIKMAIAELEPNTDPRLKRALARFGFDRESSNMTYIRGPQ